jgi:glucose-6-phosphate isomerase
MCAKWMCEITMTDYMTPFTSTLDLQTGGIPNSALVVARYLSDLRGLFADMEAEVSLSSENPLLYEVFYGNNTPKVEGQLGYCTTIIRPGRVGDEYFMTKGHYHAKADRAEVYYGLRGEGYLLLQTPEGQINVQEMRAGVVAYVPPYWGHRTINIGKENYVFLSVFPADAGYDYKAISEHGFASIVVERKGKPVIVPNPRHLTMR